jgi:hypothetical protein
VSERVLKVFLSELAQVRIVCACGVVTEMKLDKLVGATDLKCPSCGAVFQSPKTSELESASSLAKLAKSIAAIQSVSTFQIEFVLPDTNTSDAKK